MASKWKRSTSNRPKVKRRTSAPCCVVSKASRSRPVMQGLEVGLLLWRAQLQMFLNQTIRSGKPGRIAGTIVAAAVIALAWVWEGLVTWLGIQAAHRIPVRVDDV